MVGVRKFWVATKERFLSKGIDLKRGSESPLTSWDERGVFLMISHSEETSLPSEAR